MKRLLICLASMSVLAGCQTANTIGKGLSPGELTYSPSIKIEPPKGEGSDGSTQVVLNKWLWQKIAKHKKTQAVDAAANFGCVETAGVHTLLHCFSNIGEPEKKTYRNNLVSLTTYMADAQCNKRIDGIGGYLAGGNTLESVAADIVGAVGVVSTDALTSRIASGVGVGVKSLWDNSKTNFVAGTNFGTLTANVRQSHKEQKEELEENMEKSYADWPLEKVLVAIDKYDNTCDLFN